MKNRKTFLGITILALFIILITGCPETPPDGTPTPDPGGTPTPTPEPQPGDAWFEPDTITVDFLTSFTTKVYVNSGEQKIATYGFDIYFEQTIVKVAVETENNGVVAGSEGFIAAVNPDNETGKLTIGGFDVSGKGPGSALHIVTITWKAVGEGTSLLEFDIETMTDESTNNIGDPDTRDGFDGAVTVE